MSDQEKSIRADAKLKSLPPEALDRLWDWRHPAEESIRPLTYAEILELLPGEFGLSSSLASLSEFYSWLRQRRRMERAQARAEQAKLEWLRENPEASPEDLVKLGQMVFTAEAVEDGNVKSFVALMRVMNQTAALEHEREKFRAGLKSKLEAGLDALFEEIHGNPRAEELFRELKSTIKAA